VEAQEENQDVLAGERDTRTPADDPLELGSAGETPECCEIETPPADLEQASQASGTMVQQSEQTPTESVNSTLQLQQMLQGIFESIKSDLNSNQTNLKLDLQSIQAKSDQFQNSVKSDLNSLRSDLSEVRSGLSEVRSGLSDVRSDLNEVKSNLQAHQEQVRADVEAENRKLFRNFEAQTQGLRKEFNHKLEPETRRVSQLVSQVQSETTAELIAGDKH
jgi:chromosome segregation ATPase